MAECVVIADDLTGGNATGVLLKNMNYQAYTVLNINALDKEIIDKGQCIILPTDSRGISAEEAYDRVFEAVKALAGDDVRVYSHRIDSTLRGNLGSETDAMLDFLGEDYVAIAAPCFPATDRIVLGGYMLVEGIPLHKSGIAIDPKCPVKTSDVAALFREQSKYGVAEIKTNDLMHGKHYLADRMKDAVAEGNRTIVIDCVTQEDLDLIADAAITSKLKILAVDPGVFTATLARKLITPSKSREKSKILAVMGSVHPNARTQMEQLWLSQRTYNVMITTRELLESEERRENEIARVAREILENCDRNQISTVTGDGIYPENRIDFAPYMERYNCSMNDVTDIINRSLAEIAHRIFSKEPTFRALYTTGGDITVSVCERFGAAGLDLKDEVLPLAAYGTILGGPYEGIHLITKGGSQGDNDAINKCITYLKEKIYI
ncbi:MAG: four-carbon acid sugar kinase family protein [Clostridiales bacterium]|nr:four-carbon acid sugar kinase family protein [Clostridiales bacterium]